MGPALGRNNPVQNIPANNLQGPQNPQGGPPPQMQGVVAHPIVSFIVIVVLFFFFTYIHILWGRWRFCLCIKLKNTLQ